MRQELSTFSQIPGPIPDSILILPANNVGFVIVPSTQGPRSIRSQLTADQRRKALERIVAFQPYKEDDSIYCQAGNTDTKTAVTSPSSLADSSSNRKEELVSESSSEQDKKVPNDPQLNVSSAVPSHEEPECQISCAICLDDFEVGEQINKMSECSHFFHKDCLLGWLDQ
eukprot:CAMPEP_0194255362 /NCGR_PEP_ID=MMETSP0158-20130606/34246_1 /TAXON_ID=33649 /ORGANISM="Thalassionema nitzschioides, Strain L26-B" /LENGTH=169 /DNA_ID=CAMNT_0038993689 /DNA_START=269 /DNA_END=775 /DNA_ORIENTATION=-